MSSCLQRHWQENTHSTSFLPRLTLEQRAHSWRRATRADKKKKMLKNMMQASLTYWVAPRVCVCVYVCVCVCTLLFVWQKNPPDCNCSVFSPGHTLAEQWHLLCGCRKIFTFFFSFSQLLSSIVWGREYTWNRSLTSIKSGCRALCIS